ncbi:leucyl aminopeptidase [Kineosporia sp. J2-2]|uniref:Probable cytosol aminopeptidase n=1 Tax=Kineosporia corallincola TaxID=2835133 RepID=A0ABS5TLC8_9ACTN|nr:leucyl aminopeptidase [Kineosporia corallincola]MBT0770409.1 leucyl aminopeptidase [Kineosporia corallincola]
MVAVAPVQVAPRVGPRTSVASRSGSLVSALRETVDADLVAVPVRKTGDTVVADRHGDQVAAAYGVDLAAVIGAERVKGGAGQVVRVPVMAPSGLPQRFLLVGIGDGSPRDLRRAAAALSRSARGRSHVVTTLGDGSSVEGARAVVEGFVLGGYTPPSAGLKPREDSSPAAQVTLVGSHPATGLDRGRAHARATVLARDLTETPANLKNPDWFARQAADLGAAAGLDVRIWHEDQLADEGFGGVLAVGSGSATPPRFVRIDYRPEGVRDRRPVVLVGKGITFDTGGISIKPRTSMVAMKSDMAGAAVVLAALLACPEIGIRRPVTALLPLAENAFGAGSYRPGDVVTTYGGQTVEILNTDAEGRMVLADGLAYAARHLDPEVIVDIATLTGAASLGLGRRHAALYSTTDRLAEALATAATGSGEQVWRMPLVDEYRSVLDSTVADIRHVTGPGAEISGGGSIAAALFLREFTAGARWAHLDIAGPARAERDEHEATRGATGFGTRLLLRWLEGLH